MSIYPLKNSAQTISFFAKASFMRKEVLQDDKMGEKGEETRHKMYLEADLAMLKNNDRFIVLGNGEKQKNNISTFSILQKAKQEHKNLY